MPTEEKTLEIFRDGWRKFDYNTFEKDCVFCVFIESTYFSPRFEIKFTCRRTTAETSRTMKYSEEQEKIIKSHNYSYLDVANYYNIYNPKIFAHIIQFKVTSPLDDEYLKICDDYYKLDKLNFNDYGRDALFTNPYSQYIPESLYFVYKSKIK